MKRYQNIPETKDIRVSVRFTGTDLQELKGRAEEAAMSVSEYLRRSGLGRRITSRVDRIAVDEFRKALAELRRQGGLLKHALNLSKGRYKKEVAEAMHDLAEAAKKLKKSAIAIDIIE